MLPAPIARNAALAQLVEHLIRNEGVTGSSPVSGTIPSSRKSAGDGRRCRNAGSACGSQVGAVSQPMEVAVNKLEAASHNDFVDRPEK